MTESLPPAPSAPSTGLIGRVKDMLFKPADTWAVIDGEADDIKSLYLRYVLPLAAIGPVAAFLHAMLFGSSFMGVSYRPSLGSSIYAALLSYLMALASPFILSLIIDALAPNFGGQKNPAKAFQVAAYGSTAGWVAGIFSLIPWLGWLGILGLYSLYLFWIGLPRLMRVPEEKAAGYAVVVLVAAVVLFLIIGALARPLMALGAGAGSITIS